MFDQFQQMNDFHYQLENGTFTNLPNDHLLVLNREYFDDNDNFIEFKNINPKYFTAIYLGKWEKILPKLTFTCVILNVYVILVGIPFCFVYHFDWYKYIIWPFFVLSGLHYQIYRQNQFWVISHRWISEGVSDDGRFFSYVKLRLQHSATKLIFFDYSCLPQGNRSIEQHRYFKYALTEVNHFYKWYMCLFPMHGNYALRGWCATEYILNSSYNIRIFLMTTKDQMCMAKLHIHENKFKYLLIYPYLLTVILISLIFLPFCKCLIKVAGEEIHVWDTIKMFSWYIFFMFLIKPNEYEQKLILVRESDRQRILDLMF